MRQYHYTVDRDGRIFHDGSEITDPAVLRFFMRAMQRTPDHRFVVLCQGEQNWFAAADTPFVVHRLRCRIDARVLLAADLILAGGYSEPLDASTLETDGTNIYCRVRGGAFAARFGRIACQQLAPFLHEEDPGVALSLNGARHPLAERPATVPP